ncbi:MAG: methyltransferase domain-containing protein, partial [Alphaproteobacteria bacterium]|nr:methyltransferase domain-containing protein [Alphaproteobacteria bacterium]
YNHPDFKEIIKVSNQGSYPRFNRKAFERVKDLSPLTKEIFIKALKKILVLNPLFEEFLTVLRQMLLNDLDENASRLDRDSRILLATHLSDYCFMTEFIFDVTEEEQSKVNALRSRLESDPDAMADAACVSTFACYDLLASLSSAAKIEELHAKNEVMHDLIHAQISRVHEEREIAQDIPSLTAIEDEISQKVREQYEEFPYPRWREVPKDVVTQECLTNEYKPADGAKVLIAGCGTGQEVVLHSYIWPHTDILAVDISRTSMAYAIGKTKDAGQENITYRHADILKLGEALEPESFDHISCGGVLHHMRDPLEGWKSLMGLLKPGGSMLISLYSDTARQIIARTRQIIADQGVANDRKSMLAFRRALPDLLSREDMMEMFNAVDFYTTSMFRDFIFHVQEHRFTIPQIADALEKFDLEFDRFLLPDPVLIRFRKRFPEDGSEHVLKNWEIFEKENPLTFAHMYSFLSRKKK